MFGTLKFAVSFFTVLMWICQAGRPDRPPLPPPTNLTAKWIDNLTVRVSWTSPKSLPRRCSIQYEYKINTQRRRIEGTHFLENLLTESADKWEYSVKAVGTSPSCKDWESSEAKDVIEAPKPRAAVTDFKCYLSTSDMNCSWIIDPSSPVSLSYRECGKTRELLGKPFDKCSHTYNNGQRRVCHMKGNFVQKDLCMVATTPNGIKTFKAPKAVKLPNLKISEKGTNLVLTVAPLAIKMDCFFCNICYSAYDKPKKCQEYTPGKESLQIPYDKSRQYTFQYTCLTRDYCTQIGSDRSENITYGSNDWTLTVVAIVIPVIVSACVILSCICFRRHKDIIWPDVPYPSIIFKEIINGNKDMKLNVSMYTPVQEPIEPSPIVAIVPQIPHSSGLVPT